MTIFPVRLTRLALAALVAGTTLQAGTALAAVETAVPTTAIAPSAPYPAPAVPIMPAAPALPEAPATAETPAPAPPPSAVPSEPVATAAASSSAGVMQGTPTPAIVTPTQSSAATAAVASASGLTQISMVLLLVIGLIAGMAWLLRRLGLARNPTGTTIRVVSGVNLSNRERILVVEVADQWIVVGVAPGCINTLATMPRQDAPLRDNGSAALPAGKNFSVWLKRTLDQRIDSSSGSRGNHGN